MKYLKSFRGASVVRISKGFFVFLFRCWSPVGARWTPHLVSGSESNRYWNSASTAIRSLYMASVGGQDWEVMVEVDGVVVEIGRAKNRPTDPEINENLKKKIWEIGANVIGVALGTV